MDWAEFSTAIRDGGWIILLVYFLYKELWPLITKKVLPAQMKAVEDQRAELAREKREDREQRLQQQKEEAEFRHGIEQERLKSAQATSSAIQQLSIAMMQTNERIATILENQRLILSAQGNNHAFLVEAISDMRADVAHKQGLQEGKHLPKTGPIGTDKEAPHD